MSDDAADRVEGAPHPSSTWNLFGQEQAEAELAKSLHDGRMAHAWLLHGPRGIGKATLAYRLARALLSAEGPAAGTLDIEENDPAVRRVAANTDPRLRILRREPDPKTKRMATAIRVEAARGLEEFFHLSALAGGWRIAVVDAAEEMNPAAANSLLKILEEPPPNALLLLVSHAPHRLLPTIRSRCRRLALRSLEDSAFRQALQAASDIAGRDVDTLMRVAGGSVGEALRLHAGGSEAAIRKMEELLDGLPNLKRDLLAELVDDLTAKGAEEIRESAVAAAERRLANLALQAAGRGQGGLQPFAERPGQAAVWAEAAGRLRGVVARSAAVNLDPAATLLAALTGVEEAARMAETA